MKASQSEKYQLQAKVISAAGHPIRLAILEFLKDSPQCVCDIAKHIEVERSNVSKHLSVLANAGLVQAQKQGLKMIYQLKTPCILNFLDCITNIISGQASSESESKRQCKTLPGCTKSNNKTTNKL